MPRVGNDVWFGPGAKVVGSAVIGSNVMVMPNSVVAVDVPDNMTVTGVPARIRWPRGETLKFKRARRAQWVAEPAARSNGLGSKTEATKIIDSCEDPL